MRRQGAIIVVLGSDGSGKSSVVQHVAASLTAQVPIVELMHFRPRWGQYSKTIENVTISNPHALRVRGPFSSIAKVLYYVGDYTLGHLILVRPILRRGGVILWDRYFIDLIVDQRRYRYGGPMWFLKLAWRVIPKPDVIVLLDAPPEVLQSRKQEVPLAETTRQRNAYRALVESMPNGYIVDASQPLDDVVNAVNDIVIQFLAARTSRRLRRVAKP